MQTTLCRIMVFLFAVNCILPAPSLRAHPAPADWRENVFQAIEEQADLSAEEEAWLLYFYSSDPADIADAVKRLHSVYERRSQRTNEPARQDLIQPAVSTYVSRPAVPTAPHTPGSSRVLTLLAQNNLPFERLIDFIDPLDPQENSLVETVYAAEVLGNSADQYVQLPPEELTGTLEWMPLAQQRILYRLNSLKENKNTLSHPYGIMALGTLRTALWKIHAFYEQAGQKDPLFKPAKRPAAPGIQSTPSRRTQERVSVEPADNTRINLPATPLPSRQEMDIYDQMMLDFIQELTNLKNKKPDEGDAEYMLMLQLTRYAVLYALSYNPGRTAQIVRLFDEGPGEKDFTQRYSPILNNIFMVVFDTAKYTPQGSQQWDRLLGLLQDFSDPKKYSVPTRVFALEAASLLFRPGAQTQFTRNTKDLFAQLFPRDKKPPYRVLLTNNQGPTPDSLRALFAKRTADLYCPTTYIHYLAVENYGCNTHQLQELADKLASIYDGFYDIDTPYFTAPGAPAPHRQPAQCTITMKNKPNAHQQEFDANLSFLKFSAEIFAWSVGLPAALSVFRFTRGAVTALPRATKLAALARKGRRLQTFTLTLRQGGRYQSTVSRLTKAGQTLQVTTAPKTTLPISAGAPETAATASTTQTVKSLRTLANKTWSGAAKNTRVTGIQVEQHIPGFKTQTLSLSPEAAASGRLANGVRNYNDLRFLRGHLVNAQGRTVQPGWSPAALKQSRDQLWLGRAAYAAMRDGGFDAWLTSPTGEWINLRLAGGKLPWNKLSAQNGYGAIVTPRVPRAGFTDSPLTGGPGSFWGAHNADETVSFFKTLFNRPQSFGLPKQFFADELSAQGVKLNTQTPGLWKKITAAKGTPTTTFTLHPEDGEWAGSLAYSLRQNGQLDALRGYLLSTVTPWARFSATSQFFLKWGAAFAVTDHLLTPPFRRWATKSYVRELENTLKDYGNSFSEQELAQDEAERQNLLLDQLGKPQINPAVSYQMEAFSPEKTGPQEDISGSFMAFPIQLARNALHGMGIGSSVFVNDAERAQFAFSEHVTLMDRDRLRRSAETRRQYNAWKDAQMQEVRTRNKELSDQAKNTFGPQAEQEITALGNEYTLALRTLFTGPSTWTEQKVRAQELRDDFFKNLNKKWRKYERLEQARRRQQIAAEEYIPSY